LIDIGIRGEGGLRLLYRVIVHHRADRLNWTHPGGVISVWLTSIKT